MKIKKIFIMLGMVGFTGISSYAMAQSYVFRSPANGVQASSNTGIGEGNTGGEETPESNLSKPSVFLFSKNNDQLSGNVGDTGTVTIYDENGTQIGQTTSDPNGDFTTSIGSELSGGDTIEVIVDDGSESLSSTVTVPEIETDVACYDPANVGKVGTYPGCMDMLIVDSVMLNGAVDNGTYAINFEGVNYTFSNSEYNVFTGQVTDMTGLFATTNFNGDIGYWDTSNVTSMKNLFGDSPFNSDISGWDTSNVTNMSYMFQVTTAFNQNIGGWDTSNVTNMRNMFSNSDAFNQNIGAWDTSSVEDMASMFIQNKAFNQNIGSWDTSSVQDMAFMFSNAENFNQDLSAWCVPLLNSEPSFFDYNADSWLLPKPAWGTCP